MLSNVASLALPIPLAIAVVLGVLALGFYIARVHQRRERRQLRRRKRALNRRFTEFLDGRIGLRALRSSVNDAEEAAFWGALETFGFQLGRTDWLPLAKALGRNCHVALERHALTHASPWRAVTAARRLGMVRSRAARAALRRMLARGPEMVTFAAATSLGHYRDRAALHWVLAHGNAFAHRPKRTLCILLRAYGPRAPAHLARALQRGVWGESLEAAVIECLAQGRIRTAVPAIEHRLGSPMLEVRIAAARALGDMEAAESTSALLVALKDIAWQVRAQAARALGRCRSPLAVPALAARLTDPSWWVRRHAAHALADLDEVGHSALRQIAASSPDRYARDIALEALGREPNIETA